ncbi:ABC transporter substrate-binding protein [Planosporangium mesophilum]|uniref:Peptide ABC transporter substrate-binding protein n=1 Tax=Planosporangium mesophilum TaxID=689768 RepID=A0A8J3TEF4_9ACTN|nr:ABC transporter substrate-binding protein [Planosporangium mesophilum]GII24943.1 peptide ABC transporter substrate-binding protein [Planosporangium mesophilum]
MRIKRGAVVAGTVAVALGLAACGGGSSSDSGAKSTSGFNAGSTGIVNASDKKGGTLRLGYYSDVDSFDPTRIYYAAGQNFMSVYNRTLLTPDPKPGKDGLVLKPDLAEALPEISADKLTYTFKLRKGVKFEDGTPITSKDVKYAVERSFAQDVLSGGPTYIVDQLDQGQNYPGPYKDTDPQKLGLKSVQTPDDSTIIFKLAKPFADFPFLLPMLPGAVPQAKDTGEKYTEHVISTGPYKFETFDPGKKVVMVRNPNWDQSTDPIRKALPDRIEMTLQMNPDEIDKQLLDGTLDLDFAQVGVQSAAQAKILLDSNLKKNADEPNTGFIRYFTISSKVPPFDNIHCRKAVQYAADKVALQTARGGADAGGDIATNMLPPNIGGHDPKLDPFNTKSGKPQVEKAKEELKLCGKPDGFETKIAVRNKGKEPKSAEALQQALAAVGIKASIDMGDASLYFRSTIGSPDNVHAKGYGIMTAGWGADFPTGTGFLQVLVDGRKIQPSGNNNYGEINDPEINSLIDKAMAESDPKKAAEIWGQINAKVMDTATQLPFVYDKALNYRNPRLTNVFVWQYYGMWSFGSLGLSDGK